MKSRLIKAVLIVIVILLAIVSVPKKHNEINNEVVFWTLQMNDFAPYMNKVIKESFFSLLSQIALLGRATKIHLLLVSQRFDHNTIPISVREQLNVLIQIGNINKKTTQFLFPDY